MSYKTYLASPFFNEEQIKIRDRMHAAAVKEWGADPFRPDLTKSSQEYDKSPGLELGEVIYNDNVEHILCAHRLLFPLGTNDVGTLFEVGIALKMGKDIFGYDNETDTIVAKLDTGSELGLYEFKRPTLIQVETLNSAVLLGYNYDTPYRIYYVLGLDVNDNLMLRFMATRVRFNPGSKFFEIHNYDIKDAA